MRILPLAAAALALVTLCSSKPAVDLSRAGTANCYIVSKAGDYCFDASVKGNSNEPVGAAAGADVLWETYGTDVVPTCGSIVTDVSLKDGFVTFSTPGTLVDGNALIAVRDASGNILWSWHIWVCAGFNPLSTAQKYNHNAGMMMDRNLGATSAVPGDVRALGLLYQWGRKDPFLSCSKALNESLKDQTPAASTLAEWPAPVSSSPGTGTVEFAAANPSTFILRNDTNFDWYYKDGEEQDNARWGSTKTMYDPCPAGWRVPDGGKEGVWSKALGTSQYFREGPMDADNKGFNFGKGAGANSFGPDAMIWYPTAGFRSLNDGTLKFAGYDGYCWSCTTYGTDAYYLAFHYDAYVYQAGDYGRALGLSVRCVRQ